MFTTFSHFTYSQNEINIFSVQISILSWPTMILDRWNFHCLKWNKLQLPVLVLITVVKDHDKKQVREEYVFVFLFSLHFHTTVYYHRISVPELKATIYRFALKQKPWRNTDYWFCSSGLLSPIFQIIKATSLGTMMPTVSWAFSYQSSIMKMHHRLVEAFPQLRFPISKMILSCVESAYN